MRKQLLIPTHRIICTVSDTPRSRNSKIVYNFIYNNEEENIKLSSTKTAHSLCIYILLFVKIA